MNSYRSISAIDGLMGEYDAEKLKIFFDILRSSNLHICIAEEMSNDYQAIPRRRGRPRIDNYQPRRKGRVRIDPNIYETKFPFRSKNKKLRKGK